MSIRKKAKTAIAVILALIAAVGVMGACDGTRGREQNTAVVYDLNGGIYKSCVLPFTHYYKVNEGETRLIYEPSKLSNQKITRSGYDFEGWYTGTKNGDEIVFDRAWDFETDTITSEGITLYAKWDEDPRVTVHYNLEGVEDSSFLIGVEDSLQTALSDTFKERLGIDLVSDGYKYIQDGAKRFGGLFLDADLTMPFPIDTTTPVTDDGLELYVKWSDRLHLEFDYGEGKVGQESSAETDAYYVGDILGETFLQDHSPSKENSTFSGYLLDGKRFDIVNTPLPKPKDGDTLVFVASYEDYPELTIVIDYPGTLADETVFTGYFDVGEDVSAPLRTAIDSLEDEAEFGYAGLESKPSEDADAQRETFGIRVMPSEDTTVYVMAGYKTKVEITTKWGTRTETAEKYEDVLEMPEGYQAVSYFGTVYDAKTDSYIPEVFSSEALRYDGTLKGDDGRPYLFDGIFSEASMAEGTLFHEAASDVSLQEQKVVSLYQRFTKAIAITLVYEGEACEPIYVLPNAHVSDCDALIRNALGLDEQVSYSLYLQDDGSPDDGMLVKNRLPFTDCILRVER